MRTPVNHIVLVEDNEATRYSVTRILTNAGYRVTPAENGERGLALAASLRPDLVLLDVKLPDVSGFEVVRQLKSDPVTAAIPVVHLSATSITTAEQVRGLEGGADAYLTHPVEPSVLVATLNAFLRARHAEARLRRVFDTGLLGIVSWDGAGTILDANDTFLRLVGYDRSDVAAGRLRWDALAGTAPEPGDPGGAPGDQPQEMVLKHRAGRAIPALVGRASDEGADDAVAFVLDISERKAAEEALREADRRKDEFLAVLSHELRNPLAPIRNSIALLDRVPTDSPVAARARQVLERQTAHLTRIVDDLLDVTRISRGKAELQRARIDLREIVRRTTDDVRSNFEEARVELRVELPAHPVWLNADATRLSQVLANLLQNSVKFTQAGGVVLVSAVSTGERAELRVRDTGIGMDPGDVMLMFEPFTQADRTLARAQGGLGLGLSLVKGLVELHGGSVSARSEGPGRGSEFTVVLPLADAAEEPRRARAGAGAASLRILLVDDNSDAAQSLAELLELRGHRVWQANDGRTALARARELLPDVVLCDLGLPDIDGYEVARALRSDASLAGTRLVALSGYAQPEHQDRSRAAGFVAHLAKPACLELLDEVLTRLAPRA